MIDYTNMTHWGNPRRKLTRGEFAVLIGVDPGKATPRDFVLTWWEFS